MKKACPFMSDALNTVHCMGEGCMFWMAAPWMAQGDCAIGLIGLLSLSRLSVQNKALEDKKK